MNWYKGNISEAVALSKTKSSIFVVYVEGKDESTAKLNKIINDTRIREKLESDDFVAIKIEGESEPYMQFASIFQIVPVPSIFFIGKSGTPLDIATGILSSVDELQEKITKVLILAGKTTVSSTAAINDFIREESKPSTSSGPVSKVTENVSVEEEEAKSNDEIVCKDGVCYKKPKEVPQDSDSVGKDNANSNEIACKEDVCYKNSKEVLQDSENAEKELNLNQAKAKQDEEDKLAETRKYLEQKRLERIEEEKRLEKEREVRRRKEGKEMQNLRAWQKDQELKELKDNIKREKLEEQAARERIRAQIAADKAERLHKFAADTQVLTSAERANNPITVKNPNNAAGTSSDESRLQFRLASGTSNSQNFKGSTTLAEIREFVTQELLPGTGIKEFSLATTYPKRELISEYNNKTLIELELFPSAVILIIGKEATGPTAIISRNGGLLNMISIMVMTILNPIFSIFNSTKNWLFGNRNTSNNVQTTGGQKRANEDQNQQNDATKRRNLDRFLNSGVGNTTGTSNQEQSDSSPSTSQGGAYRRFAGGSNIHRLSDNRKDSDDENATWNGNSTQQQ